MEFGNLPDGPIVRINGSLVSRYVGSIISIVGTVDSINAGSIVLKTSDNMTIVVNTPRGFQQNAGTTVEILGNVQKNGCIEEIATNVFEGTYNAQAYNKLVEYMNGKFSGSVF